jgi:hypothetical protein
MLRDEIRLVSRPYDGVGDPSDMAEFFVGLGTYRSAFIDTQKITLRV